MEFPAQTINLLSDDYDRITFYYKDNLLINSNRLLSQTTLKSYDAWLYSVTLNNSAGAILYRQAKVINDTQIHFENGVMGDNVTYSTTNKICVPVKVVGYKA